MSLVPLVDEWIQEARARARRGLSPRSELAYRQDVAALARRIADAAGYPPAERPDPATAENLAKAQLARVTVEDLTVRNIEAVVSVLVAEKKAAATRARMLAAWRSFARWLVRAGHLAADPTLELQTPARDEVLPVAFSHAQLTRIVEAAATDDPDCSVAWPLRDLALVAVLAGAGLRASEVTSLRVAGLEREPTSPDPRDVDYRLRVVGKRRKERVIPVGPEVAQAIDAYLAQRVQRGLCCEPEDLLFIRTNGQALNTWALDYLVERWMRRAGVALRAGEKAHAFRHTYAVGQLSQGTSVAELQALLGHADLSTTGLYLRMSAAELQQAARAAPVLTLVRDRLEEARRESPGGLGIPRVD